MIIGDGHISRISPKINDRFVGEILVVREIGDGARGMEIGMGVAMRKFMSIKFLIEFDNRVVEGVVVLIGHPHRGD